MTDNHDNGSADAWEIIGEIMKEMVKKKESSGVYVGVKGAIGNPGPEKIEDKNVIGNMDFALKIRKELKNYLFKLGYNKALVNIEETSIESSVELFHKHEVNGYGSKHQFDELRGYYIYDECLITKQLASCMLGRLVSQLEPLAINKDLSRVEVNIRHSSIIDIVDSELPGHFQAELWYEIKPY